MRDDFIVDERVSLRSLHGGDKEIFLEWQNNTDIRKSIGGLVPFTEFEFWEAYKMNERTNPSVCWFAVCYDGCVVGITGLHRIRYIQRNAEVSILIGEKESRNKGIATRAIQMLEEYAFGSLQMHRLYAYVFTDNEPSVQLFSKCGWVNEGTLRDAAYWDGRYKDFLLFSKLVARD